jgi:WhiB family transcriptional regulator, redox-sensing transcriptional regulator
VSGGEQERRGVGTLPGLPGGVELPWLPGALCAGEDPGLWFAGGAGREQARAVCARCPARVECLEWALDFSEPVGVWGGTTPEERAALRWDRRRAEEGGQPVPGAPADGRACPRGARAGLPRMAPGVAAGGRACP